MLLPQVPREISQYGFKNTPRLEFNYMIFNSINSSLILPVCSSQEPGTLSFPSIEQQGFYVLFLLLLMIHVLVELIFSLLSEASQAGSS